MKIKKKEKRGEGIKEKNGKINWEKDYERDARERNVGTDKKGWKEKDGKERKAQV